jgi:hypothetical protein
LQEFNSKYLVRLYPYSLPKNHQLRIEYTKVSNHINAFLDNLNKKIIPSIFLTEIDVTFFTTVEDVKYYIFFNLNFLENCQLGSSCR